jgi:hypothetical protein
VIALDECLEVRITVISLKRAQQLLRKNGYTLTSYGPSEVTCYRTTVTRDKDGLIPKEYLAKFNGPAWEIAEKLLVKVDGGDIEQEKPHVPDDEG